MPENLPHSRVPNLCLGKTATNRLQDVLARGPEPSSLRVPGWALQIQSLSPHCPSYPSPPHSKTICYGCTGTIMQSVRLISYVASEEEEKRYEKPELALEKNWQNF